MVFLFTVNLAAALSLYWLTGGIVAYIQQSIALREDEETMEKMAGTTTPSKDVASIAEAEVVTSPKAKSKKSSKNWSTKRRKK